MRIGEVNLDNYTEFMKLFSKDKVTSLPFAGLNKNAKASINKTNTNQPKVNDKTLEAQFDAETEAQYASYKANTGKYKMSHVSKSSAPPVRLPGMDITGKSFLSDAKIVSVSDDVRSKLVELAKRDFIQNKGMSDGEEKAYLSRKYIVTVPAEQRYDVGWTLDQIYSNAAQKITDAIRAKNPNWQAGQSFDPHILDNIDLAKAFDAKI